MEKRNVKRGNDGAISLISTTEESESGKKVPLGPDGCPKGPAGRLCRRLARVQRRNTMDCAILNEMFINEETKRVDKRAQQLLRESERDQKHSMALTNLPSNFRTSLHENQLLRTNSNSHVIQSPPGQISNIINNMNNNNNNNSNNNNNNNFENDNFNIAGVQLRHSNTTAGVPTLVESYNRYMSVSSRPIGCRVSAPPVAFLNNFKIETGSVMRNDSPKIQSRKDFHETFANLIKLGSIDRQQDKITHEESTFQTELKDLIWLELQAWQADRTLEQQDKYLFTARQAVPDLLNEILNFKFRPKYKTEVSVVSNDSGNYSTASSEYLNRCSGCLSLYCNDCNLQQSKALKEVEELLTRLEAAEALYPSSQQMGNFHPAYKSEMFVGRVKAMCLWFNITRHHRLKLIILGKILARLQGEKFNWPVQYSYIENSSNSAIQESDNDSGKYSTDSKSMNLKGKRDSPKVQFDVEDSPNHTPSDSTGSNESRPEALSSNQSDGSIVAEYLRSVSDVDFFNVEPLMHISCDMENSTKLYRKYIENVLKSRGLAKSLEFLHQFHNLVLLKTKIALEKPEESNMKKNSVHPCEIDFDEEDELDESLEPRLGQEQISELRRYGFYSEEAKSLNLPSYKPTFVFLSVVPLEVIHEFLRMRLETRPSKPNPLSLEQLMKELREGLILALTHRERFYSHITTALSENENELDKYFALLDQFDATVKKVLELYLEYVDQWVLVAAPETHQKSALEREWTFTKLVSPMIPEMHITAAKKFCLIIRNLLRNISENLVSRAFELDGRLEDPTVEGEEKKWQLLTICRETQALFTTERERSIKVLFFAKSFCRDVEQNDFHRDHCEDFLSKKASQNIFNCPKIEDAFVELKKDILSIRQKLIQIIERVQERCNENNMGELDEQDTAAILSRSREILHQGFKYGFEYNKDVIRLFEQKVMIGKDTESDLDLALGIIEFAKMWMKFVMERCDRGSGVRPRWANQGLEFLILACDPQITRHLNEKEFEELKSKMDECISHVIGICEPAKKVVKKKASPRTRKTSSPAPSRSRTPTRASISAGMTVNAKFLLPQFSLKEENLSANSSVESSDITDNPNSGLYLNPITLIVPRSNGNLESLALRQIRVRDAVNQLDLKIENRLRDRNLIGQVKTLNSCDKVQIRARSVNFHWHRGIKIGQGRFGKVYTAVNNSTGELMAMKEISIQPGETRAIKNVAEELKILEGIKHPNLIKYYGIEIHREELLIFMELCSEGTLESLVELSGGLYEGLTRRFTAQLLSGVEELHKHGIVHRDIKTANIFLVNGGNSLKLGDFGSAVKIQAHTTVPGELQGYVGTQAYMAPEVFTKNSSEGHGRAADIWSVGCVIIEMVSGKRPWSQFDSNFQIMFKVGMGETPEIPTSLSQEGFEFVERCLQHDPKLRATAAELLQHNFCKVKNSSESEDLIDTDLNRIKIDSQSGRRSLRRNKP
ncbi:mitogen-activated protein kinase kinase kinase 4 isoform X2 [Condylostylus longicornis]|uniref:mitogen-activated protein kinase kinase kinase 4 isoform X2 n=1 Tax=Condylostylus longicornis TaxID=2530218 RepID=UPI00244E5412|nr:mitogen-activated protein kinase kinase kinase 4 isoform X2 [Condylostylus longicornis]